MGTRIRHLQVTVDPVRPDAEEGSQDVTVIPHVESGWCQCVGATYIGGGGSARWLLDIIVFEPITEKEAKAAHKQREAYLNEQQTRDEAERTAE